MYKNVHYIGISLNVSFHKALKSISFARYNIVRNKSKYLYTCKL